ncbi:MAG: hypothetical protein AABX70_06925 [Nanoarchaeota archaeon]
MPLDKQQQASFRKAIRLGAVLQREHPSIVNDYGQGESRREIVQEKGLAALYEVPEWLAVESITYTIRGYDGRYGGDPYPGLINDESELERLASQHRAYGSRLRTAPYSVRGKKCTPWSDDELRYLVKRSTERASNQEITDELNTTFHRSVAVRTINTVYHQRYNLCRPDSSLLKNLLTESP